MLFLSFFLCLSLSASHYYSLRMAKLTDVFVTFPTDFSNVPDITTGLKRSQTDGTLDQVSHREEMEQTFRVRCCPTSQTRTPQASANPLLYLRRGKDGVILFLRAADVPNIFSLKKTISLFI